MAKKTYKFKASVVVADPSKDIPAVYDGNKNLILHAVMGTRTIAAGDPIQLDEAEGERILKLVGPYVAPAPTPSSGKANTLPAFDL